MGTNNRTRRAAKARARTAARSQNSHRVSGAPGPSPRVDDPAADASSPAVVEQLLQAACAARWSGDVARVERIEVELCRHPVGVVRSVVAGQLLRSVGGAWANGWQPAELVRQARRTTSAVATELVRAAVAADHAGRPAATLDPRWVEQVDGLGLPLLQPAAAPGGAWVAAWASDAGVGQFAETEAAVQAVHALFALPSIEELIPPPGGHTSRASGVAAHHRMVPSDVDRGVLDKIRALLSKAESTTFEAEAEAFTAKAHELMTRHAIEAALVAGRGASADLPGAIRIAIDDPYRDAKAQLLHVVAQAGRCRSVLFGDLSLASVVGFGADVLAVELLYTSLLVQAQTALTNAARALPAGARQRTRTFRSSFLLAYAVRIGERLAAVADAAVADAEATTGVALVPALRSRGVAVDQAVEQRYGQLRHRRMRGTVDGAGWRSGREAADDATLVAGALPGDG